MKTLILIFLTFKLSCNPIFPIAQDKQLHLGVGFIISGGSTLIAKQLNWKHPMLIGLSIGTLAGIAKECYDLTGRGNPNVADALYTSAGSLIGSSVFSIKINICKKKKKSQPINT